MISAFAMTLIAQTVPVHAKAGEITVSLDTSTQTWVYGGTGFSHKFTVTEDGEERAAYCLEPDKIAPSDGTKTAVELPDSNKVSQVLYYCYGYPGSSKLKSWLQDHGYSDYAEGMQLYCFSHVLLAYQYDKSDAFAGWSNGVTTTIDSRYIAAVKAASTYILSLPDPAGFDYKFSFKAGSGSSSTATATWQDNGEFKSQTITMDGNSENKVTFKVPSEMVMHKGSNTYKAGTSVTIKGGESFYFTTSEIDYRNSTYTSPTMTGSVRNHTAYKIKGDDVQTLAFFAVDAPDKANFSIKFGDVEIDLGTKAQDGKTKTEQGTTDTDATFTDTVSYAQVTPGKTYTIKGTLMDKETGKAVTVDGKAVTSEKTFTPTASKGTITLTYTFDASLLKGKTTVVFEDIYQKGVKLGSHANLSDEGQTLYYPEVKTVASDLKTETQQGITEKDDVLIDYVAYSNVLVGKEYTVKGTLMNKETGEPILMNGEPVTSEVTFTAEKTNGFVRMKFIYDARALKGQDTVVFEDLYLGDVQVTSHADLSDEDQTIHYPEIKTTAIDEATGDNQGAVSEETRIIDTVSYSNLIVGKEYTVKGKLMDKDTGEPIMNEGEEVTYEATFVPEETSGTVEVEFVFDSTGMEGKSTVVFEQLWMEGVRVTVHADISDEGQTVHFPKIKTKAADGITDKSKGTVEKSATIIDTVSYSNLVPGKEYTIKGILMDKETGKPLKINGKEITSEKTFTPEKASGEVEMKFAFDSRKLEGKTVVVFEDLYHNKVKITAHADIKDKDQSIKYPKPVKEIIKDTVKRTSTPQTGDNSKLALFLCLMIISGGTLFMAWSRHHRGVDALQNDEAGDRSDGGIDDITE